MYLYLKVKKRSQDICNQELRIILCRRREEYVSKKVGHSRRKAVTSSRYQISGKQVIKTQCSAKFGKVTQGWIRRKRSMSTKAIISRNERKQVRCQQRGGWEAGQGRAGRRGVGAQQHHSQLLTRGNKALLLPFVVAWVWVVFIHLLENLSFTFLLAGYISVSVCLLSFSFFIFFFSCSFHSYSPPPPLSSRLAAPSFSFMTSPLPWDTPIYSPSADKRNPRSSLQERYVTMLGSKRLEYSYVCENGWKEKIKDLGWKKKLNKPAETCVSLKEQLGTWSELMTILVNNMEIHTWNWALLGGEK